MVIGWAAGGEIDDAQAAVTEGNLIADVKAIAVRTAVRNAVCHPPEQSFVRATSAGNDKPRDSTHVSRWRRSRRARAPVPATSSIGMWRCASPSSRRADRAR